MRYLHGILNSRWSIRIIFVLLVISSACKETSEKRYTDQTNQPSGSTTDEASQEPTLITGTYLADYTNARIRCDYEPVNQSNYNSLCRVVVLQQDGSELAAAAIKGGVDLSWQDPVALRGTVTHTGCAVGNDNLTYKCQLSISDYNQLSEEGFSLKVRENQQTDRIETASVVLPYAVGVTAGLVPAIPYTYVGNNSLSPKTALTGSASTAHETLGFQPFSLKADAAIFTYPVAVCLRDTRMFFMQGNSIYQFKDGIVSLYAGSANQSNTEDASHRQRIYMEPWYMFCTADSIYVSSSSLGRIYLLKDDGSVRIIAGKTMSFDTSADGTVAAGASINQPSGIGMLSSGELVFVETAAYKIRKITKDGVLATVAGTGDTGYSGDGGQAASATFNQLGALIVDKNDNIIVADYRQHVVRKITTTGIITTIAGTGTARYQDGTGSPKALAEPVSLTIGPDGSLYVGEYFRGIKVIGPSGTLTTYLSGGPEVNVSLFDASASQRMELVKGRPAFMALAIDSNGVSYFDGATGILQYGKSKAMTSLIGKSNSLCSSAMDAGQVDLPEASSIAYDGSSKLWISHFKAMDSTALVFSALDTAKHGLINRGVYGCNGDTLLIGDTVSPLATSLSGYEKSRIGGTVAKSDGTIFVANPFLNRIVSIGASGTAVNIAGTGAAATSPDNAVAATSSIKAPFGLTMGVDGSIYFTESSKIRRINSSGRLVTVAGGDVAGDDGDGGQATKAKIKPTGLAISRDGRIFFTDYSNGKVKMINTAGIIKTIAGGGSESATDQDGVVATDIKLSYPESIAVTSAGMVYFVERGPKLVRELTQRADGSWVISKFFGTSFVSDCGVGKSAGTSSSSADVDTGIRSSLSIICAGDIRAVTVQDNCAVSSSGNIKIAISQSFIDYSNIVEVTKPCQ